VVGGCSVRDTAHFASQVSEANSHDGFGEAKERGSQDSARQPVLALQVEQRRWSKDVPDKLRQDLQGCFDIMSILKNALRRSLQLTGAPLGNI
jgi:hypothetical protein